jgi:hypothetical protein
MPTDPTTRSPKWVTSRLTATLVVSMPAVNGSTDRPVCSGLNPRTPWV